MQGSKFNWIQKCNALNSKLQNTKHQKRKLGYVVPRVTGRVGYSVMQWKKIVFIVVKNSVYNDYMY